MSVKIEWAREAQLDTQPLSGGYVSVIRLDELVRWLESHRVKWRGDADEYEWANGANDTIVALLAELPVQGDENKVGKGA